MDSPAPVSPASTPPPAPLSEVSVTVSAVTPTPEVPVAAVARSSHVFLPYIVLGTAIVLLFAGVAGVFFVFPGLRSPLTSMSERMFSLGNATQSAKEVQFAWIPLVEVKNTAFSIGTSSALFTAGAYTEVVAGSDSATFEVLSYAGATSTEYTEYARDATNMYFKQKPIEDADRDTFAVLLYDNYVGDYVYAKDATQVYFGDAKIAGADRDTFTALYSVKNTYEGYDLGLPTRYAKDKNYVYLGSTIVPSIDPATVSLVGSFIKDANAVLGADKDIDPTSFASLGEEFYKDKDSYYCYGLAKLRVLDPRTFVTLEHGFAKDSEAVYSSLFCGPLANSDPASFEMIEGFDNEYAKDVNNLYVRGQTVQGVDPASFAVVNRHYFKDATNVYFKGTYRAPEPIKDASIASFETFDSDSLYAGDNTHRYFAGQPIEGVSISSFLVLSERYAKDVKRVYYMGSPIIGADPITFVASSTEPVVGHDKNGDYRYGRLITTSNTKSTSLLVVEYINKVRAQGYSDVAIRDSLVRQNLDKTLIDAAFAAAGPSSSSAGAASTQALTDASEYIRQSRMGGYTDSQIKTALLTAGWSEDRVNQAFAVTPKPSPVLDKNGKDSGYSKDAKYVYCKNKNKNTKAADYIATAGPQELKGADPASFMLVVDKNGNATGLAKDKNSVFEMDSNQCEAVATAYGSGGMFAYTPDASTFEYIGGPASDNFYAKDKTRVYHWGGSFLSPVFGVFGGPDVATFTANTSVLGTGVNIYDAQDKDHKYTRGRQLK